MAAAEGEQVALVPLDVVITQGHVHARRGALSLAQLLDEAQFELTLGAGVEHHLREAALGWLKLRPAAQDELQLLDGAAFAGALAIKALPVHVEAAITAIAAGTGLQGV